MGPDLTVVLPFGPFDPAPGLAKGGVSLQTSINDAAEMIISSSHSKAHTPIMIVSPDPNECASALAQVQSERLRKNIENSVRDQAMQMLKNMYLPFVRLWSTLALQTFAIAAELPQLFKELDEATNPKERIVQFNELAQAPEPALQLLRIALHMDGDRQHFFMHPNFCDQLEKVEPIRNNAGELDVIFHKSDGGFIISPVKLVCTSFIPNSGR
jgi:hypothetical protein